MSFAHFFIYPFPHFSFPRFPFLVLGQPQYLSCGLCCHAITNLLHAPDWMLLSDACDVGQIDWHGSKWTEELWRCRRTSMETSCLILKAFVAMICWGEAYTSSSVGWYQLVSWHTRRFTLARALTGEWDCVFGKGNCESSNSPTKKWKTVVHKPLNRLQGLVI